MKKKNVFLVVAIVSLLVFISYMTETGPKKLFGYSASIWVFRLGWLFIAASNFYRYYQLRKED